MKRIVALALLLLPVTTLALAEDRSNLLYAAGTVTLGLVDGATAYRVVVTPANLQMAMVRVAREASGRFQLYSEAGQPAGTVEIFETSPCQFIIQRLDVDGGHAGHVELNARRLDAVALAQGSGPQGLNRYTVTFEPGSIRVLAPTGQELDLGGSLFPTTSATLSEVEGAIDILRDTCVTSEASATSEAPLSINVGALQGFEAVVARDVLEFSKGMRGSEELINSFVACALTAYSSLDQTRKEEIVAAPASLQLSKLHQAAEDDTRIGEAFDMCLSQYSIGVFSGK